MKKIIYFGGTTCHACKALKPQIEQVCKELNFGNIVYINADIDEGEEVDKYIDTFRTVPTIILEEDGKEVARCNDNVEAPMIVADWIKNY